MISFDVGSLRTTILAMDNLAVTEKKAARKAANSAGKVLLAAVKQNISLRDHSLKDLKKLDHPYARRHGAIRIHHRGSKSLMHPQFRVHQQSGTLLTALKGGPRKSGFFVELDKGIAPHAVWVIFGTRVMLGRNVLWDTAIAPAIRLRIMKAVVKTLGKDLRTKAALRFGDAPAGGGLGV
jgi:hypothetical protein